MSAKTKIQWTTTNVIQDTVTITTAWTSPQSRTEINITITLSDVPTPVSRTFMVSQSHTQRTVPSIGNGVVRIKGKLNWVNSTISDPPVLSFAVNFVQPNQGRFITTLLLPSP